MPFAIWKTTGPDAGSIKTVLAFAPSFDPKKRAAIAASGYSISEVEQGVDHTYYRIDPATGKAVSANLPHADYYTYQYDATTGEAAGSTLHTLDKNLIPDSAPGLLVSFSAHKIFPRWRLALDEKGMPTFDADGKVICTPPEPDMTPNILHLLLAAAISGQPLDPALVPASLLDDVNTRMATMGAKEIQVSEKVAAPVA